MIDDDILRSLPNILLAISLFLVILRMMKIEKRLRRLEKK
jgi:hypothetical protein